MAFAVRHYQYEQLIVHSHTLDFLAPNNTAQMATVQCMYEHYPTLFFVNFRFFLCFLGEGRCRFVLVCINSHLNGLGTDVLVKPGKINELITLKGNCI